MKLWSLRNGGDGSAKVPLFPPIPRSCRREGGVEVEAQWTYLGHRRPVVEAVASEAAGLVVSADAGSIQWWDAYLGALLHQLEPPAGAELVGLAGETVLAAGCSDGAVRLLDVRQGSWVGELKLGPSLAAVRALVVQPTRPHYIVVASSPGPFSLHSFSISYLTLLL